MGVAILQLMKGRATVQAVSHGPVTTEDRVRSQTSPCEVSGGKGGNRRGFALSTSVSSVSIIPPVLHTRLLICNQRGNLSL